MKAYERSFVSKLDISLRQHPDLIHVVLGPRQVGKTTGVLQLLNKSPKKTSVYISADGEISRPASWFYQHWVEAFQKNIPILLVIDEIQKVENWSEIVKQVWDEQQTKTPKNFIHLLLLGSSSLHIQKGLSESLTGRYILHPVHHWDYEESRQAFGLSLDEYLNYGGYPKSYEFRKKRLDWLDYVRHSIIDPVLAKDILSASRVKSPALFKQCFDLACSYAVQEISYTKLLGQLQDKGNTELVKLYLGLFEGAFLIKQLHKFSNKKVLSRTSSPKILPLCPALYTNTLDGIMNPQERGRAFELMVGSHLQALPIELFYWREKNDEVDYVVKSGKKIWAIEVKSNRKNQMRGILKFKEKFPIAEPVWIKPDNFEKLLQQLTQEVERS